MSIHKCDHQGDFLILSNAILRSPELSLKAKGLLAFCLSLPEDWVFNIRGLAHFCADGPDSVRSAVQELENAGYLRRRRKRSGGRYSGMEYEIFESPSLEFPSVENPQLPSMNLQSINQHNMNHTKDLSTYEDRLDSVRMQIEYDILATRYDPRLLDDVVSVMVDVSMQSGGLITVGADRLYPVTYIQVLLQQVSALHVEQLLNALQEKSPKIHNTRAYLLAALVNSVSTLSMDTWFGDHD